MTRLQQLLEEFARRNDTDTFRPDDEGRFHIVVDDAVRVECFERFGHLHLVSRLEWEPESGDTAKAWTRRVLNYALKRMKHSRSTPALQEDGDAILFSRVEIDGLSEDDLESRIEEHVNAVEKYQRLLDASTPPTAVAGFARSFVRP